MKNLILSLFILFSSSLYAQSNQDCSNATQICSSSSLNDNNNGKGSVTDLVASNEGCLASGENQSSWYKIKIQTGGTLTFNINPNTNSNDYDFAIWGSTSTCPPIGAPVRCSYACRGSILRCPLGSAGPNTGLTTTATDLTEGASGDGFVKYMNVLSGETYLLMIDNYTASNSGFTLSFGGTAVLGCSVLPVELLSFEGKYTSKLVELTWTTAIEYNLDKFIVEKFSSIGWKSIVELKSKGRNSSYKYKDSSAYKGENVYRLRTVDLDGSFRYYDKIVSADDPDLPSISMSQDLTREKLKVVLSGKYELINSFELYDMQGRRLCENSFEKEYEFDLSLLQKGYYIASINGRNFLVMKQ